MTSDFGRIWVFNENKSKFPGGLFTSKQSAEVWIRQHRLSGTLTLYPLDVGVYDLFVEREWFKPSKARHLTARFIGGFTDASQDHEHYVHGRRSSEVTEDEANLEFLRIALTEFKEDVGRFPTVAEGLEVLLNRNPRLPKWRGPYVDAWLPLHDFAYYWDNCAEYPDLKLKKMA